MGKRAGCAALRSCPAPRVLFQRFFRLMRRAFHGIVKATVPGAGFAGCPAVRGRFRRGGAGLK